MNKLVLFALLIFGLNAGADQSPEEQLCKLKNGRPERLTVFKYTKWYKKVRKTTKTIEDLQTAGRSLPSGESEVCRWNRFLFADSVLYFNQVGDFSSDEGARVRVLEIRDQLYSEWLESLAQGELTGFAEHEDENVKGLTREAFLKRGSRQFKFIELVSKILNRKKKNRTSREDKEAELAVQNLLQARTPFSSIMPLIAMGDLGEPQVASAAACVKAKLKSFDCGSDNLWQSAIQCANGNSLLALEILGTYASQRMYLIRDFKAWMEQNLETEEYAKQMSVLKDASESYFLMETVGNKCGAEVLYPEEVQGEAKSFKAYHFWSLAMMASKLADIGYEERIAVNAALKPARKYKKMIALPGLLYNLLLGRPLKDGTVGDKKQVMLEQELGAVFGYNVFAREEIENVLP